MIQVAAIFCMTLKSVVCGIQHLHIPNRSSDEKRRHFFGLKMNCEKQKRSEIMILLLQLLNKCISSSVVVEHFLKTFHMVIINSHIMNVQID